MALVDRAAASGFDTLLVTVDVPVAGARLRDKRNGLSIPTQLTDTESQAPRAFRGRMTSWDSGGGSGGNSWAPGGGYGRELPDADGQLVDSATGLESIVDPLLDLLHAATGEPSLPVGFKR